MCEEGEKLEASFCHQRCFRGMLFYHISISLCPHRKLQGRKSAFKSLNGTESYFNSQESFYFQGIQMWRKPAFSPRNTTTSFSFYKAGKWKYDELGFLCSDSCDTPCRFLATCLCLLVFRMKIKLNMLQHDKIQYDTTQYNMILYIMIFHSIWYNNKYYDTPSDTDTSHIHQQIQISLQTIQLVLLVLRGSLSPHTSRWRSDVQSRVFCVEVGHQSTSKAWPITVPEERCLLTFHYDI